MPHLFPQHRVKFTDALCPPLLIILLGFFLRLMRLHDQSLWLDEAISITVARLNLKAVINLAAMDIHPPLYYMVLHYWLQIGSDEFVVRFLSLWFNTLSIALLYAIASRLYGQMSGVLASSLFAISAFQVRYAQEARMYAMLGFTTLLALYAFVRFWNSLKTQWLIFCIIMNSLSLYVHYQAAFLILWQNLFFLARVWQCRLSSFLRCWVVGQMALVFSFIPWLPILWNQVQRGGRNWIPFTWHIKLPFQTLTVFGVGNSLAMKVLHTVTVVSALFLCTALLVLFTRQTNRANATFVTGWLAVPIVSSLVLSPRIHIYGDKYLIGAAGAYYLILAAAVNAQGMSNLFRYIGSAAILAGIVLPSLLSLYNYFFVEKYQREDWRGAVRYVEENSRPGDAIVFHFSEPMAPFRYYSSGKIPAYGLIRPGVSVDEAVTGTLSAYNRVWVFDYLRFLYDPDAKLVQSLKRHGFRAILGRDFNGVKISLWNQSTALQVLLLNSFETLSDGIASTWDRGLDSSRLYLNSDSFTVSHGKRSLCKEFVTNSMNEIHYGGLEVPLQTLTFSLDFWIEDSSIVQAIYVYSYDQFGDFAARWSREVRRDSSLSKIQFPVDFAYGVTQDRFAFIDGSGRDPQRLDIILEVDIPNAREVFCIDNLRTVINSMD